MAPFLTSLALLPAILAAGAAEQRTSASQHAGETDMAEAARGSGQQAADYHQYMTQHAGAYQQYYQGYMSGQGGGSEAAAGGWVPVVANVNDPNAWEDAFLRKYAESYRHYVSAGKQLAQRFPNAPASAAECHSMAALNQWRAAQRAGIEAFVPEADRSFPRERVDQEYQESRARIHSELAQEANRTRTQAAEPVEEKTKERRAHARPLASRPAPEAPPVALLALRDPSDATRTEVPTAQGPGSSASASAAPGEGAESQPGAPAHKSRSELRREDEEKRHEERARDEAQRREARREDEAQRREARHEDKKERHEERREDEAERRADDEKRSEERRADDEKRSEERRKDNEKRSEERREDEQKRSEERLKGNEKRSEERRKDNEKRGEERREDEAQRREERHKDSEKRGEEPQQPEAQGEKKRAAGVTTAAPADLEGHSQQPPAARRRARASLETAAAAATPSSPMLLLAVTVLAATAFSASATVALTSGMRLGGRRDVTFTEQLLGPEVPLAAV